MLTDAVTCGWLFTAMFFGAAGYLLVVIATSYSSVVQYDNM